MSIERMNMTGNIVLPLETLILKLESEGFNIGPDIRIRMQKVLKELGRGFCDKPHNLKQIICPLVAKNRIEQDIFNRVFDEYFSTIWEESERKIEEIKDQEGKKEEVGLKKKLSLKLSYFLIGFMISVIAAVVLALVFNNSSNEPPPIELPGPQSPNVNKTIDHGNLDILEKILLTFLIVVFLISFVYILITLKFSTNMGTIVNKKGTGPPYFLPFPDQNHLIELPIELTHISNAMRQRREGNIQRFDIPESISCTIRSGGFPELKFKQSSIPPEYLVLIDKQGFLNQQAKLFEHLVDSLESEDIFVEKFFFHSDPRFCWNKEYLDGFNLQELHNKFPKHHLLIFSDGAFIVDSYEAQLKSWAKSSFENWSEIALLTPVAFKDWGYKEQLLNAELFVVLPADISGQLALIEFISNPEKLDFKELRKQFFDKNQISCQIDFENISDLRRYLDNDSLFYWVCALAIYPKPYWEITLVIGKKLEEYFKNVKLLNYDNLIKLTRIKWLQKGDKLLEISGKLLNKLQEEKPEIIKIAYQAVSDMFQKMDVPEDSYAYYEKKYLINPPIEEEKSDDNVFNLCPYIRWGLIW